AADSASVQQQPNLKASTADQASDAPTNLHKNVCTRAYLRSTSISPTYVIQGSMPSATVGPEMRSPSTTWWKQIIRGPCGQPRLPAALEGQPCGRRGGYRYPARATNM